MWNSCTFWSTVKLCDAMCWLFFLQIWATGTRSLHCLFYNVLIFSHHKQSLTKTQRWITLLASLWQIVSICISTAPQREPRSHSPDPWTHNSTGSMIRLQWKTHMSTVKGVCNSTHVHAHPSHCAPLKGMCLIPQWAACVSVVQHLLQALLLKALVRFLHSQDILERKLNLTCKTVAE